MLFNSYEFIFLFFPIVLVGFLLMQGRGAWLAAAWLALASLFFYGWWRWQALPLLLASIVVNYAFGLALTPAAGRDDRRRKQLLWLALAANLGLLGAFKYADFFVVNANVLRDAAGAHAWALPGWVLPIGISFYTFTQIAYLVDSWRGEVRERRFVHYLLFVTYFPHLIAGPVLHHAQMMPQFARAAVARFDASQLCSGFALFAIGLAKKLLIADPLGQYADLAFGVAQGGGSPDLLTAWSGVLAYSFQLYFDFSGYSDMAMGLSRCFGIELPLNFASPYKATSLIDFWRRWHISLSTFLRDYLYIPLGGNRLGVARRHINLFATMLLGGLWHGAAWTFVIWGAMHGAMLVVNHLWRGLFPPQGEAPAWRHRLRALLGGVLTFGFVCIAWTMFRADSAASAWRIYEGLFGLNGVGTAFGGIELPYKKSEFFRLLILAAVISFAMPPATRVAQWLVLPDARAVPAPWRAAAGAVLTVALLGWGISYIGRHSAFLYFQF